MSATARAARRPFKPIDARLKPAEVPDWLDPLLTDSEASAWLDEANRYLTLREAERTADLGAKPSSDRFEQYLFLYELWCGREKADRDALYRDAAELLPEGVRLRICERGTPALLSRLDEKLLSFTR